MLPASRQTHWRSLAHAIPLSFLRTTSLLAETPPWGFFSGTPKVEPIGAENKLRLLTDFSYTDPHGRAWLAPAGSIAGDASIPNPLRSTGGGPFEKPYLAATLIHGAACERQTAAWPEVRLAFYHALRCGGVDEIAAKIMYYTAYRFGPRWGLAAGVSRFFSHLGLGRTAERDGPAQRDLGAVIAWIEQNNPSLHELHV